MFNVANKTQIYKTSLLFFWSYLLTCRKLKYSQMMTATVTKAPWIVKTPKENPRQGFSTCGS